MNQNMWQLFVDGLAQTHIVAIDPATFKVASGLAIANWEIMDTTGIGPTEGRGTPIPSSVYAWADPMPDETAMFYQPGSSLSGSYAMYLNSLKVSGVDSETIKQARSKTSQFQMKDSAGNSWPGYSITPGLNDFLTASLMSVGKPPQIDFSVEIPDLTGGVAPPPQAASAEPPFEAPALAGGVTPTPPPINDRASPPVSAEPPFFGVDREPMITDQPIIAAFREPPTKRRAGFVAILDWLQPRGQTLRRSIAAFLGSPTAASTSHAESGTVSTIRFQVQTAQMFSIQPDRWFSENAVNMFNKRIDPASALANRPIFGQDGFLNGRASRILVAFKRVVTVSGQASMIAGMETKVQQATETFNVGSFHFAAAPGQTGIKQTAPGTIIFQDNTDALSIIGVIVEAFGP